jgi:hypothetical protein
MGNINAGNGSTYKPQKLSYTAETSRTYHDLMLNTSDVHLRCFILFVTNETPHNKIRYTKIKICYIIL